MNSMTCTLPNTATTPRTKFLRVLNLVAETHKMTRDERVLIIGGSAADEQVLRQAGFKNLVNSNLPTDMARLDGVEAAPDTQHVALDAENIDLPSNSYDMVFASEVLHHCQSPHHALCEMLRVARKYVIFMEPNDSLAMNTLVKYRFSFPFELPAVIDHNYTAGGLRDTHIPNFIYRWNRHEVVKTVSSCIPERIFSVSAHPYWDFGVNEEDLKLRKQTRIGSVTSVIGARNFIALLRTAEFFLNLTSPFRGQGNKFFCCIEKTSNLQPWMEWEGEQVVFNRKFGQQDQQK